MGFHFRLFLFVVMVAGFWRKAMDEAVKDQRIGEASAGPAAQPAARVEAHGQQHPVRLYLLVWALLFVLSACSYAVDYFNFHGYLRWSLIILFMMLKAGLIVAVFMHMAWERLALVVAILTPPLAVLVFVAIAAVEGDYTNLARLTFFGFGGG
jgi:cytochrome c oxidase subunit IV